MLFSGVALLGSLRPAFADSFDFSYVFGDGNTVSGTFDGTVNGSLVTGLTNISLSFNSSPIAGSLYTGQYDGANWVVGGVVSFDVLQNNFIFINDDIANGGSAYDSFFYMTNSSVFADLAYGQSDPLGVFTLDSPPEAGRWTLRDTTHGNVPDSAATVSLLAIGLVATAGLQRRFRW